MRPSDHKEEIEKLHRSFEIPIDLRSPDAQFWKVESPLIPEEIKTLEAAFDDSPKCFSYNGIAIPDGFGLRCPIPFGEMRWRIALKDSLRPELSVSRDRLDKMPWKVFSHMALAFAKAIQVHGIRLEDCDLDIFPNNSYGGFSQDNETVCAGIRQDALLKEWAEMPIIQTAEGKKSLRDIQGFSGSEAVRIQNAANYRSFEWWCAATLLQQHFEVKRDAKGYTLWKGKEDSRPGAWLFPPLGLAKIGRYDKLIDWLIENAEKLEEEDSLPFFEQLKKAVPRMLEHHLNEYWMEWESEKKVREILNRLPEKLDLKNFDL